MPHTAILFAVNFAAKLGVYFSGTKIIEFFDLEKRKDIFIA